jgi:type II secretory pathway predicted ATPase ExeA
MYERFFAFQQRPFSLLPDPDFLFLGDRHRAALDKAELAVLNQCGFCVISGEVGVGKTTLLGELLRRLDHRLSVGLVSNTHASFGELMQWIAAAFGLQASGADRLELQQRFVDFVIQRYAHNQRTLLIIDEAQNLSVSAMEELRMLSNLNCDKHLVLQVMLVGQPGLRDTLRRPELAQFAQRIAVEHHLSALTASETRQYIAHRLAHAGGDVSLFNSDACRLIQDASGGIPRLINRICDLSLVYAYAQQRLLVGPEIVAAVLRDQELGGLFESVRQSLPNSGDSGPGPTEPAAPRADIASAGARPPLQRHLEAAAVPVGGDASRPISAGLSERPAAVSRARSAVAAAPAQDLTRASAAPAGAGDRDGLAVAVTGSRDQSAAAAAAQPVSELYRVVVNTEGRRARYRGRGTALAVAVAFTVAVAGWLSRDRLPELASGLVNNQPGATTVFVSRSLAGAEPTMPLAGQPMVPDAELPSVAPVSSPDEDPRMLPSAVSGSQAVASVVQQPERAAGEAALEDAEVQRAMQRIEELRRQAELLARERRATAQQVAAERRARERLEHSARAERERIRAAERAVAAGRESLAEELQRPLADHTAPPNANDNMPLPVLQVPPAQTSERAGAAQDDAATPPDPEGTLSGRRAAAAAPRQDDRFVPNPCNGPTAKFMTTCF